MISKKQINILAILGILIFLSFVIMCFSVKVGLYIFTFSAIGFCWWTLYILFKLVSFNQFANITLNKAIEFKNEGQYFKGIIFGITPSLVGVGIITIILITGVMIFTVIKG
jgi:hypothetical protein